MEEHVGALWHRWVTRMAETSYPDAAMRLADIKAGLATYFRALGGCAGLQIEVADARQHGARRSLLQRIAGGHHSIELAWRDDQSLRLPAVIDWFPDKALNRDLYYWLAALAVANTSSFVDRLQANQQMTRDTLQAFPGLQARYQRLLKAHLAARPDPAKLDAQAAAAERAIRDALTHPGSVAQLPSSKYQPAPVLLWLYHAERIEQGLKPEEDAETENNNESRSHTPKEMPKRRAKRVNKPGEDRGLITVRMENIFTWGEFVNVDRGSEDEEDEQHAEAVAKDLDQLAISRDSKSSALRLKFDLDLPSEADDDHVLDSGILLPEWDWRKHALIENHCRIVPMMARDVMPIALPKELQATARRLRNQFQSLQPARVWQRGRSDGQEIDIDAYLRYAADRASGVAKHADNLYRELDSGARDLACLLMADLSLSTDTWINDHHRVIDVIRDSLFLFAESLDATGDRFAMYGFSSRKRDPVRIHQLKSFDEKYTQDTRGRIAAIKPGYYTRMGAAVRYGSQLLIQQGAGRRLLLLLTDGKPNDLDQYEGRYGIEDTRQAIQQARHQGLRPFCVTIDEKANDYLPYLFGSNGYVMVRNPEELPARLPKLYAQLTAS